MPSQEMLKQLKALPLDVKVMKSKQRIREMLLNYPMYISVSGIDSCAMKYIVREIEDEINENKPEDMKIKVPQVFSNTGLEFRSVREQAQRNADIIVKPKYSFREILIKYGYPIISKNQARYIEDMNNSNVTQKIKNIRMNGSEKGYYKISEKWKYLIDADFKISSKCCYHMKKSPLKRYGNKSGRYPFIGSRTEESAMRKQKWKQHGCNMVDTKSIQSMPISFWTHQDVLQYVKENNIEYPEVYGDIVEDNGKLYTTGEQRTGCIFCGFGVHMEDEPNRFQRLKVIDEQLYNYVMGGGEYNKEGVWIPNKKGLGFSHVLAAYGVPY